MKRFAMILLLLALTLTACAPSTPPLATATPLPAPKSANATQVLPTELPQPKALIVFADASLSNIFAQMAADVQASHPGLIVDIRYGDSQSLRKQIEQGAQADVFASADPAEMDSLVAGKFVDAQTVNIFLVNKLVVVLPALNTANLTTLQDLAKPGVKVTLAANELTLGKFSQQALDNLDEALGAGYKDSVLKNVVSYEQDASQVLSQVQLGKADAGIVYASDLVPASQLLSIEIPNDDNAIAQYSIAVLLQSANPDLAQVFADYALSANGQNILQKWGFLLDR